ncbi:MAG: biotin--[acetyl-CoA-carboxylase] ligase [Clostridia bacterium]|nr:biotin--[acetyl-CoA-carboxylase] ligase [Clostridia bacterium]
MEIEKIKKANTKIIGKEIIYYESIASTQKEAKAKLKENSIKNGTIIIAGNQTGGIGTKGRTWYTNKEENITMTIVLYPKCSIHQLEGITIQIAKAMKDAIKDLYNISLQIKYPNDLLLNGKKIGGILTESATTKGDVTHLLIGIGFNVNQTSFPKEIETIATSLKKEMKKEYTKEDIIIKFIEKLEEEIKVK